MSRWSNWHVMTWFGTAVSAVTNLSLLIMVFALCPGRPHCSLGHRWWVQGGGLGWQDTRHASSIFKTSSWQAVASHCQGPIGCGSDTNYWQLCVSMILDFKLKWNFPYFSWCAPRNQASHIGFTDFSFKARPPDVSSGIMSSSGWVNPCVYGKDTGKMDMALLVRSSTVKLSHLITAALSNLPN